MPTSLVGSVLRCRSAPIPGSGRPQAPFALDAVLWLTILGFAVLGWWRAPNRLELLLVVLPALALTGALMLTSGNYGTMQRLRVQTSVLLIPVAAGGLSLVTARWRVWRTALDRPADSVGHAFCVTGVGEPAGAWAAQRSCCVVCWTKDLGGSCPGTFCGTPTPRRA